MKYQDLDSYVDYLRVFPRFSPREYLKLDRIQKMLALMGHPEKKLKGIQIAGTNGKGSTVALAATALQEAGYKTGAFYSPHLVSYTERFKINGRPISQRRMVKLVMSLKPIVEKTEKAIGDQPTWFEVLTAAGVKYFVSEKVDWAVFEVGLGGRFDATTALGLRYKIITDISQDHTHILGRTVSTIAKEKAGIIQPGNLVITSNTRIAFKQIQRRCQQTKSKLIESPTIKVNSLDIHQTKFTIFDQGKKIDAQTSLIGGVQAKNAGLVYKLLTQELKIPSARVLKAFRKTKLEGRFQILSQKPLIIIDGAHNVAALGSLLGAVNEIGYLPKDIVVVFATKLRKKYRAMIKMLGKNCRLIILPELEITNIVSPRKLKQIYPRAEIVRNVRQAITLAKTKAKKHDIILITGSFYFIGEVIRMKRQGKPVKIDQIDDNQAEQKHDSLDQKPNTRTNLLM